MSKVCVITGKGPMFGHKVSHANNKTKRRFLPNLQTHRYWVESLGRRITLRLSTQGMRIIDKYGIEKVLEAMYHQDREDHGHDNHAGNDSK